MYLYERRELGKAVCKELIVGVDFTLCQFEAGAGNDCVGGKCTTSPLFDIRGHVRGSYMYKTWASPSGSRCSGTGRTDMCQLVSC